MRFFLDASSLVFRRTSFKQFTVADTVATIASNFRASLSMWATYACLEITWYLMDKDRVISIAHQWVEQFERRHILRAQLGVAFFDFMVWILY